MTNKLYELSCIIGQTTLKLSYSHDVEKLCRSVPCRSWTVVNEPSRPYTVREYLSSEEGGIDYFICEVNFIV